MLASLLLALALPAQAGPLARAYFQHDCSPWDSPALGFFFPGPDSSCGDFKDPSVSIIVSRALPKAAPRVIAIKTGDDAVLGTRCVDRERCEHAVSGTLTLDRYEQGKAASGSYELKFKDGTVEKGRFKARWCDTKVHCG